jgi:hypothetical protein
MVLALLVLLCFSSLSNAYQNNTEWGNITRLYLQGFHWNYSQAMEPFLARNGPWLFWNTRNVGDNISLHYGTYDQEQGQIVKYIGPLTGQANGKIPHLDAVPSMDKMNNFYWVSTRDYPQNPENLQQGAPLYSFFRFASIFLFGAGGISVT